LPVPATDDLAGLFYDQLVELVGSDGLPAKSSPTKIDPWGNLCFHYIRTPRDIARVMNVLRVTYPLFKKSADEVGLAVEPMDFVTLQVLHLFDVDLYLDLRRAARTSEFSGLRAKYNNEPRHRYIFEQFNLLRNARDNSDQDIPFWPDAAEYDLCFRYISAAVGSGGTADALGQP
jgi:hypothetical protein